MQKRPIFGFTFEKDRCCQHYPCKCKAPLVIYNLFGCRSCLGVSYPAPGFDPLVYIVWKAFPRDKAAGTLLHLQLAIFQNNTALADDNHGKALALHALEDIHLHILQEKNHTGWCQTKERIQLQAYLHLVHWNHQLSKFVQGPVQNIFMYKQHWWFTRLWVLAEKILVSLVFQMTRSASEPTAIRPLQGYMLKILAAFVLVTATNSFSSILPVAWWSENMSFMRIVLTLYLQYMYIKNTKHDFCCETATYIQCISSTSTTLVENNKPRRQTAQINS